MTDLAALRRALAAGPGWPADPAAGRSGSSPPGAEPAAQAPARPELPQPDPLCGLRVLDLSRVLAGPYAAMVLADLGADVIKVERPGAGDDTRGWGPPFHGSDAAYFLAVNRNRRALALDLRTPTGHAVAATLAGRADVVVENFLPRHADALGLPALRAAAPQAAWVSIRGAGSDGPDGGEPGYDVLAQARSGLMHITGAADGPPSKVGVAIADVVAGLHAAVAALAGVLAYRSSADRTAPHVEVPLLESTLAALVNQAANHLIGGLDPVRRGNDHPNLAPYGPYDCADEPLVIAVGNDRQFADLAAVVGLAAALPPGAADQLATNAGRVRHRAQLDAALTERLTTGTAASWAARLAAVGVPSGAVHSVAGAFADAHVQATDLVQTVAHPAGALRLVGSPYLVDGHRPRVRTAPPAVGEHTSAILTGLGLGEDQVEGLRAEGVVA